MHSVNRIAINAKRKDSVMSHKNEKQVKICLRICRVLFTTGYLVTYKLCNSTRYTRLHNIRTCWEIIN